MARKCFGKDDAGKQRLHAAKGRRTSYRPDYYIVLLGWLERRYRQQAEVSFSYTDPKSETYASLKACTNLRVPKQKRNQT